MHVAPARKEKTRLYFLPHTRGAGYLNGEWKMCGNRGTPVLGMFFLNEVEFSEAHYLLGVLGAPFIVLQVCLQIKQSNK